MTAKRLRRDCVCGHPANAHDHYRPGSDCGRCGHAVCRRYQPLNLADVCRDDTVIDDVLHDRIDHALTIAEDPVFVALLTALADAGRRP